MLYYLSLGSNLGAREETLRTAIQSIEQRIGHVRSCSSFYYSAPWGFESDNMFCNLCCAVESTMPPMELLEATQSIERALGRTKKTDPQSAIYTDRCIDIDIIRAFEESGKEIEVQAPNLTIPHPLWQKREFVTVPLAQIMP